MYELVISDPSDLIHNANKQLKTSLIIENKCNKKQAKAVCTLFSLDMNNYKSVKVFGL